ncbi:MAG: hypothetical protein HY447_03180 [Candidatus Omnitrophica bacterium]|nr:hypothetical protein [Candidatus Omnitrophota bacterium]
MTRKNSRGFDDSGIRDEVEYLKKHLDKLWERAQDASERLQDIEVHLNLLTRLLTALCVERLGMRIGVLKRMIKKIEKEAIRDSQIHHLEKLYNLHHVPSKKSNPPKGESEDRWEDIS